jgi:O-antigen/teichoic acid export membrane protein
LNRGDHKDSPVPPDSSASKPAEQPAASNGSAQSESIGGREVAQNVLWNWAAQLVQIASGFVVPRMIDSQVGQDVLGLWDFAWSIVASFALVQMGLVSSVNRFVARDRAKGDFESINRVVSSVTWILRGMAAVVVILSVAASFLVEHLGQAVPAEHVRDVRWLILLLGSSLALQIATSSYAGVLTGYHRWGTHNAIHLAANVCLLAGMFGVLLAGYGLVGLGMVTLVCETLGRSLRSFMAYRVCPTLEIRWRHFRRATAREIMVFSGKAFSRNAGNLVLNQGVAMMVAAIHGPAALAVYARPFGIIRAINAFMQKYAMIFTPMASGLHAKEQSSDLEHLIVVATRSGILFSLPLLLATIILGREIMLVWMGPDYAHGLLIGVLAFGYLTYTAYSPILNVLTGIDAHGRPSLAYLAATGLAAAAAAIWLLALEGGIVGVAVCVVTPMFFVSSIYLPAYACTRLGIGIGHFLERIWLLPLACCAPFAGCLIAAKLLFPRSALLALIVGLGTGSILLGLAYWRYAIPAPTKRKIAKRLGVSSTHID